jgi:hypothetical protein
MDTRLYPISPEFFTATILPLIEGSYICVSGDQK